MSYQIIMKKIEEVFPSKLSFIIDGTEQQNNPIIVRPEMFFNNKIPSTSFFVF